MLCAHTPGGRDADHGRPSGPKPDPGAVRASRAPTHGQRPSGFDLHLPFQGLLFHAAGQGKNGFCVVDVFESEEAVERFNEVMASIPREVGIEEPPDFFPAHTFISG